MFIWEVIPGSLRAVTSGKKVVITDEQVQVGAQSHEGEHRAQLRVAAWRSGAGVSSHKPCCADREHLF